MVYLDNNSTTACSPDVVAAMEPYWLDGFANASSSHVAGRKAAAAVAAARGQIAELVNCKSNEIVFTSGATESNNLLFLGMLLSPQQKRQRIVVSAIEHKSVLEPAKLMEANGFEVTLIPAAPCGAVDLAAVDRVVDEDVLLVSVQAVNNELGTIQPVNELSAIAHASGAFFHTDATQMVGKVDVDFMALDCDYASFSAHKMYGPKGIGGLFVRGGPQRWPWARPLTGGGQEMGLRPGTCNVPGAVGFGVAARMAGDYLTGQASTAGRDLETYLLELMVDSIDGISVHCRASARVPGVFSLAVEGVPADLLVDNVEGVILGRGSACSNGAIGVSHVLKAIGCTDETARNTFRVSMPRDISRRDLETAAAAIAASISTIRGKLP